MASVVGSQCRWNLAGDLILSPNVTVDIVTEEGIQCYLFVSVGKHFLLKQNASLSGSSISIDASFVHLEAGARLTGSYYNSTEAPDLFWLENGLQCGAFNGGMGGCVPDNVSVRSRSMSLLSMDLAATEIIQESWKLSMYWDRILEAQDTDGDDTMQTLEQQAASKVLFGMGHAARMRTFDAYSDEILQNNTLARLAEQKPLYTRGGGRIRIVASRDLVVMDRATIIADGDSARPGVPGGSGGSIYLSATAVSITNGSIRAKGGDAFCLLPLIDAKLYEKTAKSGNDGDKTLEAKDCFPAGGGGRIMITYQSSELNEADCVDTTGGSITSVENYEDRIPVSLSSQLTGATGTFYKVVYNADHVVSESNIIISNRQQDLSIVHSSNDFLRNLMAPTLLFFPSNTEKDDWSTTEVMIRDGALVVTNGLPVRDSIARNNSSNENAFASLKLINASVLIAAIKVSPSDSTAAFMEESVTGTTENIQTHPGLVRFNARDIAMQNQSRWLVVVDIDSRDSEFGIDTSVAQMEVYAQTFATDASVNIQSEGGIYIWTSNALNFDANVSTAAREATNTTSSISGSLRLKIVSGEDVFLGGHLHVGSLYVRSERSISLTHGSIDAKMRTQLDVHFSACNNVSTGWATDKEKSNFTLVLNAGKSIFIGYDRQAGSSSSTEQSTASTLLLASAIQICAVDHIEISAQTIISSNGRGAQANQGPGHGNCVGSVGGGAGYGGRGADSNSIDLAGDYAAGGLIYGSKSGEGLVGSGGGCTEGGSGGGIIRLGASSLELNGQLHCDGAPGVHGAGGGSGGFLGITISTHLIGDGGITATGGTSTCIPVTEDTSDAHPSTPAITLLVGSTQDEAVASTTAPPVSTQICGGGGGGGRLQLRGCKKINYDQCTHDFEGDYTVHGGATLTVDGTPAEDSPVVDKSQTSVSPSPTYINSSSQSPSSWRISKLTKSGSDGSFFGFPCPPGYGGLFCRVCPVGTYKSESNSEECKTCHNAPANSHYVGPSGVTSTHCPWACDPGYTGRTRCVSPLQQLLDTFGGEIGCGIVLIGIVLFFILLGYACRNRKEPSTMYTHHVNHEFFFSGTSSNDSITMLPSTKAERQRLLNHPGLMAASDSLPPGEWFRCTSILCCWLPPLVRCISWAHVKYPKLMERDLPEHMARLYFAGTNDRHCPLRLRTSVPSNLEPVLYGKEFQAFANKINAALGWPRLTNFRQPEVSNTEQFDPLRRSFSRTRDNTADLNTPSKVCCCCHSWGDVLYRFMFFFCYPLAANVLHYRRHVRMNAVKQMIAKYNHAFMKGPRARGLLNAVKLGYSSDDYSLVYLDLLFKESFQSTCVPTNGKIGKPALPIVLLFAGRGTYRSPLYLDPNDLLVRSIPQCPELTAFIDEQWIEIVSELNTLLRCVVCQDWGIVQTLLPAARFLENINARNLQSQTNRLGGLRMHLGRFYVQDPDEMGVDGWEEFKLGLYLTTSNSSGTTKASTNKGTSKPRKKSASFLPGRTYTGYNTAFDSKDPSLSRRERRQSTENANDAWSELATSSSPASSSTSIPSMAGSQIRAEALRLRSTASGEEFDRKDNQTTRTNGSEQTQRREYPKATKSNHVRRRHPGIYKIWQGPIDTSLPVSGVLITSSELEDRLVHHSRGNRLLFVLHRYLLPCNVPLRPLRCLHHRAHHDQREDREEKPSLRDQFTAMGGRSSPILTSALYGGAANPTLLSSVSWILHITLLCLLMIDLAITFATIANMKCVNNGQVDVDCSVSILIPIMLFPVPLAIIIAPVTGISSLALSSPHFSRQYAIWNRFSMLNVGIAVLCGILNTSRLVAPWFAGSFPILPMLLLAVKAGEAYLVERYIAFQETYRRRRGWRGLMKRRLSDASNSGISPSMSPPETP